MSEAARGRDSFQDVAYRLGVPAHLLEVVVRTVEDLNLSEPDGDGKRMKSLSSAFRRFLDAWKGSDPSPQGDTAHKVSVDLELIDLAATAIAWLALRSGESDV